MGTTLEGKQINQTYQALLKTTDNTEVSATAKEITDGKGNGTGVTLDNSGNIVATATVTANAFVGSGAGLTNVPNAVTSVNSQTGAVTLTTSNIAEGSNEYYTDAKVSANTSVAANTAKTGITSSQASAIVANTAKNSYPSSDATKLAGIESSADVTDTANVTSGLVSATSISETDKATIRSNIGAGGATAVSSVNSQTGTVVLDTDDIGEGTNKYTTAANLTKLGHISVSQAVDLDTMESNIATNNSKVGITTQQASDITTNNAKNTYPSADGTKVGFISVTQAVDLDTIESDVTTNNAKVGITTTQASEIAANTLKTGITSTQASNITANNAKVSMVLGTSAGTALEGDTSLLQLGTTSTTALAGDTTTISGQQASDISTNNAKVGITTSQADAIVANTAKTGITTEQANAIVANTSKVGITTQQASDITANNSKVGITTQQAADIVTNNSKNSYPSGDSTKVGFISVTQAVDLDTIESDVATNNAKTGITSQQATDISTNNAKISFDSTSSTKLAGIAENATNVTNNNQITNGAGYINEAAQTIHTNAIGNAIDFSARVTLDGGVAEGTSGIIKNLQNIL